MSILTANNLMVEIARLSMSDIMLVYIQSIAREMKQEKRKEEEEEEEKQEERVKCW